MARLPRTLPLALCFAAASAAAGPVVTPWSLPTGVPSAQPSLVQRDGRLHLSWIESRDGLHRLRHAALGGGDFGPAREIARGRDWFVNWADFPSLAVLDDGSLAAHLLVKRSGAPYAYDVRLLRSRDGEAWSEPVTVHDDGTATEHGFVSLWPSAGGLAVAWLDGRETGGGHGHGHGGGGAMTLRAARFGAGGKQDDVIIDEATCDCCQTDVALAARGPVLVYRDRTADEIRDIALVRLRDGAWTAPATVHADGWHMPACPVNGPAVAARGDAIAVAWYTAAAGEPEVRLARSGDDGVTFAKPTIVARGAVVQGRVDIAMDDAATYVSWIDEDDTAQTLQLARYAHAGEAAARRVQVARLARGRATGFPRLALHGGIVHLVWTDVLDRVPRVLGARVAFGPE